MGRSDAVQFNLEVAAEALRLCPSMEIEYLPGWMTRGNGQSADYEGGEVHHTASNSSASNPNPTRNLLINGRPDLDGPLCNWTGPWCTIERPKLVVVAAFPANHAGASGGRSMGPLPVTTLFNKRVLGLEIDYAGSTPMTAGQRLAALVWSRAVTNVLKRSIEYIRAHAETSVTGKWDIGYASGKTVDMAAFRRDAAGITPAATAAPEAKERPDMRLVKVTGTAGPIYTVTDLEVAATNSIGRVGSMAKAWGIGIVDMTKEEIQELTNDVNERRVRLGLDKLVRTAKASTHHFSDNDDFFGQALTARHFAELAAGEKPAAGAAVSATEVAAALAGNADFVNAVADRAAERTAELLGQRLAS